MRPCITSLALTVAICAASAASANTYQISIQNQIPGGTNTGQPFSAPVVVVHNGSYNLFQAGGTASQGLIQVAEEGDTSTLEAEAQADSNVKSVTIGTGPFFDTQTINIEGDPGDLVSIVWMLGRTNDLFSGIHNIALPSNATVSIVPTDVWDAGSESNSGLVEDLPFYGNMGVGTDTFDSIQSASDYSISNDPTYGGLDWSFPPSGHVQIQLLGGTATNITTWGRVKDLYR